MTQEHVSYLLVATVCAIVFVSWVTIDKKEFNRKFERMQKAAEEED